MGFPGVVMREEREGPIKRAPGDSSLLPLARPSRRRVANAGARPSRLSLSLSFNFFRSRRPQAPTARKVAARIDRACRRWCAQCPLFLRALRSAREKREERSTCLRGEDGRGPKRCPQTPVIFRARALLFRRSNARTFLGCGRMDAPRNGCSRKYSVMTPPGGAQRRRVGLGAKRKAALLLSLSLSRRSPSSSASCCCCSLRVSHSLPAGVVYCCGC